jgi:hypothetical protein
MFDDGLDIPDFLRRDFDLDEWRRSATRKQRRRERKIPYPRDGYLGIGLRASARERLRAARRRHAERCRIRD